MTRRIAASLLCAAGTVLVLSSAPAGAEPDSWYGAFGVRYTAPDRQRAADYGLGGTVGYGVALSHRSSGEISLFANVLEAEAAAAESAGQQGATADLLFALGDPRDDHVFLLAGGGLSYTDVAGDAGDDSSGHANVGIGWRWRATRDGALRTRAELRAIADSFAGGQNDFALGVVVELGPRRAPAPAPAAPTRVVRLEPARAPVAAVDVADADADGIPDERDKCPATLAGATVERDGCIWREQTVTLGDIRFTPGSATLTEASRARLVEVVRSLRQQADLRVDVHGHTDSQGGHASNFELSDQRAAAVREFLIDQGIAASRLMSAGFGETKPIDDNATETGRARNRRVELHIHGRRPE